MGKKLRNVLIGIAAVQIVAWAVGQVLTRRLTSGGEDDDEFRLAAVMSGKRFHSRARRLRSGSVAVSMGGVDLDLRDATLDDAGATLDVKATMGGVNIVVPDDWAVDVHKSGAAGGVETKVTPREQLPIGAPALRVNAQVRMAGVMVTTGEP